MILLVDLPVMRKPEQETEFVGCRVTLIKWVANYMHLQVQKKFDGGGNSINSVTSQSQQQQSHEESGEHEIAHASLDSSKLLIIFIIIYNIISPRLLRHQYILKK